METAETAQRVAIAEHTRKGFVSSLSGFCGLARHRPVAAFWMGVIVLLVFVAVAAPILAPYNPLEADFTKIANQPTGANPFGTDYLGRDQLSRLIYGGRVSLTVALTATLLGIGAGSLWGLASGYLGGRVDLLSQRLLEILGSIPGLMLAMLLAFTMGASLGTAIVAIGFTKIVSGTRVIRSVVLSVREMPYVDAARSIGASQSRIMTVHVAPQTFAPFFVLFTTSIGTAILTEASLGFLGLGVAPPTPSWGGMLGEAAVKFEPRWWMVVFPGLFITIAVLGFNLAGDGLRDVLDPRSRGSFA